jgi:ubiquitin-protein ligase
MKKTIKRITNIDIKRVSESNLHEHGIHIEFDENDITKAKAMVIGPKDTIYEGGYLFFSITFPVNYPFSPPLIKYHKSNNVRIHPNIYVNGKVCLSILGTWSGPKWTSAMDIINVFITIQSLLDNNPLKHEPGYDVSGNKYNKLYDKYNNIIQHNTIKSLILHRLDNDLGDFNIFKDIINKNFKLNKNIIENKLNTNIENKSTITIPLYHICEKINYEELLIIFKKFDLIIV